MAVVEASTLEKVITYIGELIRTVVPIVTGGYVTWYFANKKFGAARKRMKLINENLVFTRIKYWRVRMVSLTTGNEDKDVLLLKYAEVLLNSYEKSLNEVVANMESKNRLSPIGIHIKLLDNFAHDLKETDIPCQFVDMMSVEHVVDRSVIFDDITIIEGTAGLEYFEQLSQTFDAVRLLIELMMSGISGTISKLNGRLDALIAEEKKRKNSACP